MNNLRFAFLFLLSVAVRPIQADDSKIILWFNDSSKIEVLFSEYPSFSYTEDILTLYKGNVELSWTLSQLVKFTIEDATHTHINNHVIQSQYLNIVLDHCEVYYFSGRKYPKKVKYLTELPTGIYLIREGNMSTKVIIK